jgi:WhiB family redox-sensing transcriptional regulator
MDWRHRSACMKENPDLFFPIGHAEPAMAQAEDARRVCQRCEVRQQCLAWALETGLDHGIMGGLTELERRALRRARSR